MSGRRPWPRWASRSTDPAASAERARRLEAPTVFRRTHANEQELPAFRAPDGTEVFLADLADGTPRGCRSSRAATRPRGDLLLTGIDHVNLAQPWQDFDEAVLFYSSVLALRSRRAARRSPRRAGWSAARWCAATTARVRLALNVAPLAFDHPHGFPQHVAFSSTDVMAAARAARERGLRPLADPRQLLRRPAGPVRPARGAGRGDARARRALRPGRRPATSPTSTPRTVGGVFFEVVQRRGGYDGYGAANAPVRLAAQHAEQD